MKCIVAIGILVAASATARAGEAWKEYDKGIRWEKSLDAAKQRAAKEGKAILFHQLVGDMDKEGC
jgi:hypothetical protein